MPGSGIGSSSSQKIAKKLFAPTRWELFDAPWYCRRYHSVLSDQERNADDQMLQKLWREEGVKNGRSPNRFFDEKWYLHHNGDVLRGIQIKGIFESGFQHYCEIGYRSCSPHWLFDLEYYLRENNGTSLRHLYREGFKNGYDYFLKLGDQDKQNPHFFFNQEIFIKECLKDDIDYDFKRGGFDQYLDIENKHFGKVRTSWYFDPKWYLQQYPDVVSMIESGQYVTPLHHYLGNGQAQDFDPNPFFSERYYTEHSPDVRDAIEKGVFRNGYEHFIASGVYEHRQPHEHVDLIAFAQSHDVERLCNETAVRDIFALWIKKQEEGLPTFPDDAQKASYQKLAVGHIETALPSIFRSPLSFVKDESSTVSVILLSEGDYASVAGSLLALHQQQTSLNNIILVSNGNKQERSLIQQFARGITLIHPDDYLSEAARLDIGLRHTHTDNVIVLRAGMQILPGGLTALCRAIDKRKISGGTGQIVGADGYIREAGCQLWRDGSLTIKGSGERVSSAGNGAECFLEATQDSFFFGKKNFLLKAMGLISQCGLEAGFAPLVLSLRAQGVELHYIPDILVRNITTKVITESAIERQARMMRRCFPQVLMRHPLPGGRSGASQKGKRSVLMVFPYLPRKDEGGPSRRIFGQIAEFQRNGWKVTVAGLEKIKDAPVVRALDYPISVECVNEIKDIGSFFMEHAQNFNLLWVNGAKTLSQLSSFLMDEKHVHHRIENIVLDTVTQDGNGLRAMEAHLRRLVGANDDQERLRREASDELSHAWMCQCIIAGDKGEKALIRRVGLGNVCVLPSIATPVAQARQPQEFYKRHGLLFPLCIMRPGDAAHDGFDWFCLHVMPHVKAALGHDIPLWVGGYHHPSVDLGFYERFAAIEGLVQPVSDDVLMEHCRVLIAPTRILSAVPSEVIDGAARGLPSVISSSLIESLGWEDRKEALNGGFNDPKRFAEAIIELYQNGKLWNAVQENAYQRVVHDNKSHCLDDAFSTILDLALNVYPLKMDDLASAQEKDFFKKRFEPSPLSVKPDPSASLSKKNEAANDDESDDATEENQDAPLQTRLGVELSQ